MENLIHGLGALGSTSAIAYLIAGSLIGVVVGVIPGLSTVVILSIILVFSYKIDLTGTLCLFLGCQCGSFYAASVSAILLNTPSHPEAFPVTFDGYPMARKGQPGRALGLSAASTCLGGFVGCAVLVGFLQIINSFPSVFHPPEYLALVILALLLVGTIGADSVAKAIISAGAGLVLSSVGASTITGAYRFTFGSEGLSNGISLVALALGIFAIPQMVMVFGTGKATAAQDLSGREIVEAEMPSIGKGYGRELLGGVGEAFRHWKIVLQSGIVGGVSGIIPGIGGFTGNFLAYGIAKQTSKNRANFGTGAPEGIIGPEGSSLAKEAGHIVPLIGLGIPGGVSGALFLGALAIKNIKPGAGFQTAFPHVSGEIVWIIALSGLIGTIAGVLLGPQIAKITRLPGPLIFPFIIVVCLIGPFLSDSLFFSVGEVVVFGIVGLALRRLGYPLGSFILALVLGPTFETNVYLTRSIYPGISFLEKRPLADAILAIALLVLVTKAIELRREARKAKIAAQAEASGADAAASRTTPYPVLSLVVTSCFIAFAVYTGVTALTQYNFENGLMPEIGAGCVLAGALCRLAVDVRSCVLHARSRRECVAGQVTAPGNERDEGSPAYAEREPGTPTAAPTTLQRVAPPTAAQASEDGGRMRVVLGSWGRAGQYRREIIALGWLAGLTVACWLADFPVASAAFVLLYGLTCTRSYFPGLRGRLLFSIVSAVCIYFAVYEMFNISGAFFTSVL